MTESTTDLLPAEFADLEQFSDWCLGSEAEDQESLDKA